MIAVMHSFDQHPLRLIVGGRGMSTTNARSDAAVYSARALIALAPRATRRRYWLIDPLPTLREVAAGAPLTPTRRGRLDLAGQALAMQVREDDVVAQVFVAALERGLQDAEQTVADAVSALTAAGTA